MLNRTKKQGYIFTNKSFSYVSIMSLVLGVLSLVSVTLAIVLSYKKGGENVASYGYSCLLAMIYAIVSILLGVTARMERERFYLLAYIGIALSVVTFVFESIVLYAGAYL